MIPEKIKVLYVDDEEQNLISFRANFRKEYEVYTAISAEDALTLLSDVQIPIIISDQRMPNTTGVEFLEKTLKLYPDCIRLLITGYSDIENVIEAINRGQISKYIQKPWDWEKLAIAIDNCVTLYTSRLELKSKNEQLKKANDELQQFVYSISHDLRSPLTSILGVINLTKSIGELRIADPYFELIEGRVLKLDEFIKNILDYYRNSKTEIVNENIQFQPLILSIWDTLRSYDNKINFELLCHQQIPFIGDNFRMNTILDNLISNAIKFQNPSNTNQLIKIIIHVNEIDTRIVITDNGIGINDKYINHIFDMFYRAEESLNTEGTGIGLYIVKEAVEKMKGTISVKSIITNGTIFEIIIPNKLKS